MNEVEWLITSLKDRLPDIETRTDASEEPAVTAGLM